MSKQWLVSLILTIAGVTVILVTAFTDQSVEGFAVGGAITFIGLWFSRQRSKD